MPDDRPLPEALESFAERLTEAVTSVLPAGGTADLRERIDGVVGAMLERLDLVPRDEFERQLQALSRMEAKLAALEARLAAIERSADR